ncbi:tyrosine-type recombinase/integrase [Streptacidiphilus melanogenes]|uniref:tyrosine-type recombinase/integrase n=1 Tax=Streptacidiphilus melanogenes TaxID=411235 RepID=UPI000694EE17|nr:site-specific integrase [Streptacidiphilus melanogenes]
MSAPGSVYKRCGCREAGSRRQLGRHCPKLARRGHGSWYFSLPTGQGRPLRRGGYTTRDQARAALHELRARTIASEGLTVGQWMEQWLTGRTNLRASTRRNYRSHLDLHLLPALGDIRLAELDTARIQAAFDQLAAPGPGGTSAVSPVGLHRVRAALRTILNAAVRAGLLEQNPARQVCLTPTTRPHPVVWTDERVRKWERTGIRPAVAVWTAEQTAQFLTSIGDHCLYAAFHVIALRGLRRGEATGLRWSDLDLTAGLLTISRQVQYQDGRLVTCPPKSRASNRTIALDPDTIEVLRAHRTRQNAEKMLARESWRETGHVFTRPDGTLLSPEVLTQLMRELNDAACLPPIRLHDLRHGAATLALAAGADLKVVRDMLGHSSIVLTADTYTSVLPQVAHQAAADTAALIRAAGSLVPGTRRRRQPDYPRPPKADPLQQARAA